MKWKKQYVREKYHHRMHSYRSRTNIPKQDKQTRFTRGFRKVEKKTET
jgi:hypothetical protein